LVHTGIACISVLVVFPLSGGNLSNKQKQIAAQQEALFSCTRRLLPDGVFPMHSSNACGTEVWLLKGVTLQAVLRDCLIFLHRK